MHNTHVLPLFWLLSCSAALAAPATPPHQTGRGTAPHPLARPIPPHAPTVDRLYSLVLARAYPAAVGTAVDKPKVTSSDAETLSLQSYALIKLGQPDRARKQVTRALALSLPDSRARALALVAKAALADADGKTDDAVQAFILAGKTDANIALPYLAFADHFVKIGQPDNAKVLLRAAHGMAMTQEEKAAITQALSPL